MASAEPFPSFDGFVIVALVLNQGGSCGRWAVAMHVGTPVQSVGLAGQFRRQIPERIVTGIAILLRQSHLLGSIKRIEPFLCRQGGGAHVARRRFGIFEDEMFVSLTDRSVIRPDV